ncbi:MAG: Hsp70 family protein, partial [Planctomycetales bacterium]|nr:Hsp70 family protein [Planctomycetales bacterium]
MSTAPREFDPLVDQLPSRFVVGIDLGTTNSAVAYVDTQERPWQVHTLAIPQLVAPGQVESRETLPSFLYQAAASEMPDEALRLPWQTDGNTDRAPVGVMAREEGTSKPQRLIASAKSWLCHTGVDRTADLLPWHGAADIERMSPVEASSRYLRHMHDAWNARFPDQPLAEQDVVLTLPASFDEVARELTIEAARRAGLNRVVLIEEPQAAFYAWVHKHADDWDSLVSPGQSILVCDIGGGTSDFTLIRVRRSDVAGENVQFHRVAVGEHLILGGDNLDLALARHLEQKLTGGGKLPPHQWDVLVRRCRRVKETLLGEQPPESLTVNLPSSGSRLIGG